MLSAPARTPRSSLQIIMLHHCLLKKSETLDFTFELHSPIMMEGKNREVSCALLYRP